MPNTRNINKLIKLLEATTDDKFSMKHYFRDSMSRSYGVGLVFEPAKFIEQCGTAACIQGWVCVAAKRPMQQEEAAGWLGISLVDSNELFVLPQFELDLYTREDAIKTLKRLRDTGIVRWDLESEVTWSNVV